jgi:hypothetical protein
MARTGQATDGALRVAVHDRIERKGERLDAHLLGRQHLELEAIVSVAAAIGAPEEHA